jgi:hypothetical protein
MVLCKDCKHLIWYTWWWPYIGIETEEVQECDHPKNYKRWRDVVTGEYQVEDCPSKSPDSINKGGKCGWFEPGKHEENFEGKMSEEYKKSLRVYYGERDTPERSIHPWWKFWR